MYEDLLRYVQNTPPLYAPSSAPFWDDEHISERMLAAHLSDDTDAASRRRDTIEKSAHWIASLCPPVRGQTKLLDLGCGPGLYAERFHAEGFAVTGVDLSRRSIAYARESAAKNDLPIEYLCADYLDLDFRAEFDLVTLIYCDFGVLSPADRKKLLMIVKKSLKPGGLLVLDAWTRRYLAHKTPYRDFSYQPSGFWSAEKHLCIEQRVLYPETDNYLEQYIVVTADRCEQYNIWNQAYTVDSMRKELESVGFSADFYGDVTGAPLNDDGETLCAVARAL